MKTQIFLFMAMITLISCANNAPNMVVIKAGDLEITKEDLFHHVNATYSSYPEIKSESLLKEKNPIYYSYIYLLLFPDKNEKVEQLKSDNIELYHSYAVAKIKDSENSKEYLLKNNELLYHLSRCVSYRDNSSLEYLKSNNSIVYNYVMAINETLMTNEYIDQLKP